MFADRLDVAVFSADEPVAAVPCAAESLVSWSDEAPEGTVWLPERVFQRLRSLGEAYDLHILSMLGPDAASSLNSQQCAALASELEFLCTLVLDPVVRHHAPALVTCAQRVARSRGAEQLLFEQP